MTQQDPDAGSPAQTAGQPTAGTVWERELPWQMASLDNAGELGTASRATLRSPGTSQPAAGTRGAAGGSATPAASRALAAVRRSRETVTRPGDGEATDAGAGDSAEDPQTESFPGRVSLTRPVLAGTVGLGVLLLVAIPALMPDDPAPAHRSGAARPAEEYSLRYEYRSGGSSASPSPGPGSGPTSGPSAGASHRTGGTASAAASSVEDVAAADSATPSPRVLSPQSTASRSTATAQHRSSTVVHGTSVLEPGQTWSTGSVVLAFQGDGDLVLYDKKGHRLWWSGTAGQGAKTVFQADGNLVVYTRNMRTAWSSRTDGHDGARLVLRADGNVIIQYGQAVLWSTRTAL
ncbi:hypothetical protein ACFWBB_10565 [Streptomyces sp. NPDC060000]|uniref:hypothetical protein n=1 Tax=Streptomyces sp. NPDC060000 TaxID=3347031 RepID=UPI00369B5DB1